MAENATEMPMNELVIHLGITNVTQGRIVIRGFMPGANGLSRLASRNVEDVRSTCVAFPKRRSQPFELELDVIDRIVALALWAKDFVRIDKKPIIDANLGQEEIHKMLQEAMERDRLRKNQKSIGEGLISQHFQVKLKSQGQWEKWMAELRSTLNSIIGVNGVPLTYVIRKIELPAVEDPDWTYSEMAINLAPLRGEMFTQDARTVHQIILRNIHEDSDAFAYLKPLWAKEDGRKDILELRERYESEGNRQALINNARATLNSLRYKNERSFPFERFCARLQGALDDLEQCGRPEPNGNVVDALWDKIQAPELQSFLNALKVDYLRTPCSYRQLLKEIASQIVNFKPSAVAFASQVSISSTGRHTQAGSCPDEGVHTPTGCLFIGSYPPSRWNSPDVRPFHDEIRKTRAGITTTPSVSQSSRSCKRRARAVRRSRSKIAKLKAKISSLQSMQSSQGSAATGPNEVTHANSTVAAASMSNTTIATNDPHATPMGAGTSFGGRASMREGSNNGGNGRG